MALLQELGKVVFGTDAVTDAINNGKIKLVIVACDAAERTRNNFKFICNKNKIPIYEFETIEKISKYIGKNNKAVIVVKDENFAKEIIKKIDGGEIIG